MSSSETPHDFHVALQRFLARDDAWATLPTGTWLGGGCWPLARALARFIGPAATMRALTAGAGAERRAQHIVVPVGAWYLDGDGACDEPTLLRRWQVHERVEAPALVEMPTDDELRALDFGDLPETERAVLALLIRDFPRDPAVWQSIELQPSHRADVATAANQQPMRR